MEVSVGEPVEFRCIATGSPAPSVEWTRGPDGPLRAGITVRDGVFRIPSARTSDQSEYYCKATNAAGSSDVRTVVYVTGGERDGIFIYLFFFGGGGWFLEDHGECCWR